MFSLHILLQLTEITEETHQIHKISISWRVSKFGKVIVICDFTTALRHTANTGLICQRKSRNSIFIHESNHYTVSHNYNNIPAKPPKTKDISSVTPCLKA